MTDKAKHIVRAVVFLLFALGCGLLLLTGNVKSGQKWPYAGVLVGLFLAIASLKNAFRE